MIMIQQLDYFNVKLQVYFNILIVNVDRLYWM